MFSYSFKIFLTYVQITSIEQYLLRIFAFLPFSLSQKFSYFVFELHGLVSNKIVYHRSASFPIKYIIESMVYYSHLPNMVSAGWFWRISRQIGADQRQRSIFKWIISTIILKTTNLNIGKPRKICHHAEHLFGYSHVFFCSFLTMLWPIIGPFIRGKIRRVLHKMRLK